jgi:hypothetical protein
MANSGTGRGKNPFTLCPSRPPHPPTCSPTPPILPVSPGITNVAPLGPTPSEPEVTSTRKRSYVAISEAWQHFTKIQKVDGSKPDKCTCNYCGKEFGCTANLGTSTLTRHAQTCSKNPNRSKNSGQQLLAFGQSSGYDNTLSNWKFDQEVSRRALAEMIILDELPFSFIENEGFRHFCESLQPKFKVISRITITKNILQLFAIEKQKLRDQIKRTAQ